MLSTVFFTVGSLPCNQVTEMPEFNDVDIYTHFSKYEKAQLRPCSWWLNNSASTWRLLIGLLNSNETARRDCPSATVMAKLNVAYHKK